MLDKRFLDELQKYVEIHLMKLNHHICESKVYIDKDMCEEPLIVEAPLHRIDEDICESIIENIKDIELEDFIKNNMEPSFNQILFNFIDKKGVRDSDIYKRAGIDRKHFSKIRSNPNYHIGKNTAVSLAMALQLDKKETDELLNAAGYSLTNNDTFDLVIKFCIEKQIYDIDNVNLALDYFSLKPLTRVLK